MSVKSSHWLIVKWLLAVPVPSTAIGFFPRSRARSSVVITTAPPPSVRRQQSRWWSGSAIIREEVTCSIVIGLPWLNALGFISAQRFIATEIWAAGPLVVPDASIGQRRAILSSPL